MKSSGPIDIDAVAEYFEGPWKKAKDDANKIFLNRSVVFGQLFCLNLTLTDYSHLSGLLIILPPNEKFSSTISTVAIAQIHFELSNVIEGGVGTLNSTRMAFFRSFKKEVIVINWFPQKPVVVVKAPDRNDVYATLTRK